MNTQEILIPVPWGHISAKTWGNPLATRVLCIHGRQDNCETFDRLIPLLHTGFYFLCIDLPGHGQSSHFGAGFRITLEHFMISLKRVVDYLKWTKFKCIGHSLGGMVAGLFAAIYPEHLDQLVMLDCAGPISIRPEDTVKSMRKVCDDLLNLENKTANRGPPSYTYEQAINLLLTKRPSKLTPESANVLVKRSLQTNSDGHYSFTTDQRMKLSYNIIQSPMQQWMVVQSIKCPLLYIWVTDNPEQKRNDVKSTRKLFKSIPNARVVRVNGNHDVHLNHPERIADLINVFFVSEKSKL
ncbi:serine hydrolase-like protein isoform X2 [Adelges cooleyi]|uniref:serine hydrolase-like protein isoform X2 n=1 Tax=Adelges cooleyi TaxID=133065 RepID=UPI0021805DE6|nr:serine hydrolase-like protein isoform X2 [Adelges cooleyi]XP_050422242.1 serine hydrolase-like protein isoform X2 [Adelges cooleyi]